MKKPIIFQISIRLLMVIFTLLWLGKSDSPHWAFFAVLAAVAGIIYGMKNQISAIHPIWVISLVIIEHVIAIMLILQMFVSLALAWSLFGVLILLILFDGIPRKWDRSRFAARSLGNPPPRIEP